MYNADVLLRLIFCYPFANVKKSKNSRDETKSQAKSGSCKETPQAVTKYLGRPIQEISLELDDELDEKPIYNAEIVEKVVEKPVIVTNHVELPREVIYVDRIVEKPIYNTKIVEKPVTVTKFVDRIIEKPVYLPPKLIQLTCRPGSPCKCCLNIQTLFPRPDNECHQQMVESIISNLIRKAQKKIHICLFRFTWTEFFDQLKEFKSAKPKVSMKIIVDSNRNNRCHEDSGIDHGPINHRNIISWLLQCGIQLKSPKFEDISNGGLMHNKFAIIDSTVVFGSMNWTHFGLHNNYESMMIIENTIIARKFSKEFNSIWNKSVQLYSQT